MQAFTFLSISKEDPLWTDAEEPLPIEQADYTVKFPGPRMLLTGTQSSGQVRWIQSQNAPKRDYFRDRYTKLAWSSSFPYNILQNKAGEIATDIPWDQAVVFRTKNAHVFPRLTVLQGMLLDDGVETLWTTTVNDTPLHVTTRIRFIGEFELRSHTVAIGPATHPTDAPSLNDIDIIEGSYALGLPSSKEVQTTSAGKFTAISAKTGKLAVWPIKGYPQPTVTTRFGGRADVNVIHPRMAVLTLGAKLALGQPYISLWYASPKPMSDDEITAKASAIIAQQAS